MHNNSTTCLKYLPTILGVWEDTRNNPLRSRLPELVIQPKIDGCRAYFLNGCLWSRTGRRLAIPSIERACARIAKDGIVLDGELWHDLVDIKPVIARLAKGQTVRPDELDGVRLHVFDCASAPGGIRERLALVGARLASDWLSFPADQHVEVVPFLGSVDDEDQLDELLTDYADIGGEGLVLRCPNAPYIHGNTNTVLKLKPLRVIDAMVHDVNYEDGRFKSVVVTALDLPGGKVRTVTARPRGFESRIAAGQYVLRAMAMGQRIRVSWRDESEAGNPTSAFFDAPTVAATA